MAAKKGEWERTSSWAAKRRCSGPTQIVTIGEVRVLIALILALKAGGENGERNAYLPTGGLWSGFLGFTSSFFTAAA